MENCVETLQLVAEHNIGLFQRGEKEETNPTSI